MARTCTVCNHKDVQEINRRLVCSDSIAGISRDFVLSEDSLRRHKDGHLPKSLIASPSIQEITNANNLLHELEQGKNGIDSDTAEIIEMKERAISEGNLELALKALDLSMKSKDRVLKYAELQSKILGIIQSQPQINLTQVNSIYQSPEWLEVGRALAEILAPFPDLKAQVAGRLLELAQAAGANHEP